MFVGALLAGALIVLIGVSLAQELRRRYLLEQHVRRLRADIEAREARVAELLQLREYLSTDAYVERTAREKLNYVTPGERVVVVPELGSPPPSPESASVPAAVPAAPPWRQWVDHLSGVRPSAKEGSRSP